MLKIYILLALLIVTEIFPQQKYFIYFKDKGQDIPSLLNKTGPAYTETVNNLSPRSIERRIRNMGKEFIDYDDIPVSDDYKLALREARIEIINELSWFNSVSAYLTEEQLSSARSLSFVRSVEAVRTLYFMNDEFRETAPDDFSGIGLLKTADGIPVNYGNSLRQLNISDIPFVHSRGFDGSGVIVGLMDTGFDWKRHESLRDRNVLAEYDFIFNDSVTANQSADSPAQDRHGTFIFSLIAGFKDSILIGPAFNSSYLLAKTEDVRSETQIEEDNYAAAIIWMESMGADITSSSLGYSTFDSGPSYSYKDMDGRTTIVTRAAELSFQRGVSVFTSAGNEGNTSWRYITAPADGFNTIAVGAVDASGSPASFSSLGPTYDGRIKPDVAAFGVSGFGAVAGSASGYATSSGTSVSAPLASGTAALLLSAHPHLKNTQIRSILLETASNAGNPDNQSGYGIISAKRAIEYPNLQKISDSYFLNKIILEERIDPQSVRLIYGYDGIVFPEAVMNKVSAFNYKFAFPDISPGRKIYFHIIYSDSLGNHYRSPEQDEYHFVFGDEIISLNLHQDTPPVIDGISEFFPNPFVPGMHDEVGAYFESGGGGKIVLKIFDAAGQKVYDYSALTQEGLNYFSWDGRSGEGYLCASGIYFAYVNIDGGKFVKKIVLLK